MSERDSGQRQLRGSTARRASVLGRITAALVLLVPVGASYAAEEYQVSDLQWTNHGAYLARVSVKWKSQATGKIGKTREGCLLEGGGEQGDSYRVANGDSVVCHVHALDDKWYALEPGDEVWLHVDIAMGDNKSCRKDDVRLIFNPKAHQKGKYRSGGTTLNNNRCKWGDVEQVHH